MGWLPDSVVAAAPLRNGTGRSRQHDLAGAARGCDACPLQGEWPHLKTPHMPLDASGPSPDVLLLGEAPGEDEDKIGRPFVGRAGQLLHPLLPYRYRDERGWAMTNALRCRPPNNRDPKASELHACSEHLEADIAGGRFKAILIFGGVALSRFMPGMAITHVHGLRFPLEIAGKALWGYPTLHPSFVLRTGGDGDRATGQQPSPAMPILENDLRKFFSPSEGVATWPDPVVERPRPEDVICAYDEETARHWLGKLLRHDKPVGLDIETNSLRPNERTSKILTAAVSDGGLTVAWPIQHRKAGNGSHVWGFNLLFDIARRRRWVAHHAGFELAWLQHWAPRERARRLAQSVAAATIPWPEEWQAERGFDDSMAVIRLVQRRETALGLGAATRIWLGTDVKALSRVDTEHLDDEPLDDVLRYNGLDAWGCYRVFDRLHGQVDADNYQSILDTIASVTEMQLIGLDVDQEAAIGLRGDWHARVKAAEARVRDLPEVERYQKERQTAGGFNLGSAAEVGEILVDYYGVKLPRNSDGTYNTTDATLTREAPVNPLALAALELRHARKMLTTYVEPVIAAPGRFLDGRLHPVYSTVLTRTYRTSCEDINAQNYPKRKDRGLRKPIVPPKGCVWASADYGQLEARVYGMASRDKALCASIIAKEDIHTYWLDYILARYPEYLDRLAHMVSHDGTEQSIRSNARDAVIKSDFTFASFYGASGGSVSERTGIPYDTVLDILGDFWRRYHGAARWLKEARRTFREQGFVRDLFGRERYAILWGNEMINNGIQGSAARLVLDAQNDLHRLFRRWKDPHMMPRINVHDDLIFALPEDDGERSDYIDGISGVLTEVRYPFQNVPLAVTWSVGTDWADMAKVREYTGDYVH